MTNISLIAVKSDTFFILPAKVSGDDNYEECKSLARIAINNPIINEYVNKMFIKTRDRLPQDDDLLKYVAMELFENKPGDDLYVVWDIDKCSGIYFAR